MFKIAIKESIGEAFVFGFRIVILICAGLSVASAAVAWFMIPKDSERPGLAARFLGLTPRDDSRFAGYCRVGRRLHA